MNKIEEEIKTEAKELITEAKEKANAEFIKLRLSLQELLENFKEIDRKEQEKLEGDKNE